MGCPRTEYLRSRGDSLTSFRVTVLCGRTQAGRRHSQRYVRVRLLKKKPPSTDLRIDDDSRVAKRTVSCTVTPRSRAGDPVIRRTGPRPPGPYRWRLSFSCSDEQNILRAEAQLLRMCNLH